MNNASIQNKQCITSALRKSRVGQRALSVNRDNIPSLLKEIPRWLVWGDGKPANEEGKLCKDPINPRTGRVSAPTSPNTWTTFEEAWRAYQSGRYSGIGFALSSDSIGKNAAGEDLFLHGFDFDEALLKTGTGYVDGHEYNPDMRIPEVLSLLSHTYAEVSPSGIGLRMFAMSTKRPCSGKNKNHIEYYTQGRYLTVTGQVFSHSRVEEVDEGSIDIFIEDWLDRRGQITEEQRLFVISGLSSLGPRPDHIPLDVQTSDHTDRGLFTEQRENIERLKGALAKLDPDMTEPEFFHVTKGMWYLERICGWTSAKELARSWASGSLQSSKSKKYYLDAKYRQLSVAEADLEFDRKWSNYTLGSEALITEATIFGMAKDASSNIHAINSPKANLLSLGRGLIDTSEIPSDPPPYVIGTFAAQRKVTTLAGLGGVSKTMWSMHLAVAVALGKSFGKLPTSEGAALLLLGEEDSLDIDRRFKAILEDCPAGDRSAVRERVRAFPFAGQDMRFTRLHDGNTKRTQLVSELIQTAEELGKITHIPVKLIVIDHVRLAMAGDANAADHATELIGALTEVASETNAAVMLLAHSPKSSIQSKGNEKEPDVADIAGSGAFVNNARSAEVLVAMNENEAKRYGIDTNSRRDYVKLVVVKNNIGRTGEEHWYRREERPLHHTGVLVPIDFNSTAPTGTQRNTTLQERIVALIREKNGELTANALRNHATRNGPLKASQIQVAQALETLVAIGKVAKVEITKANRGKRKAKVGTVVLEVKP